MKAKLNLLLIILLSAVVFLSNPLPVEARQGCCSSHGGVCGCGCCDGSPLSSTCAPYYPQCSTNYQPSPAPSYVAPTPPPPPVTLCTDNSTYSAADGKCHCDAGYYPGLVNNVCKKVKSCPSNSTFNTATEICVCDTGYVIQNGMCIPYVVTQTNANSGNQANSDVGWVVLLGGAGVGAYYYNKSKNANQKTSVPTKTS